MMRFPLRLTAALASARLAQLLTTSRPLVQRVDSAEILHANSSHPIEHAKLRALLREKGGTILWLGGGEPLEHPGIAHLVRTLTKSGRLVFLETNGIALRRRIHEFQPLANLFLVVRFDADHPEHFAPALESLRAARLSGFYTVAFSPLTSASTLNDLPSLNRSLTQTGIDGWLICAASDASCSRAAEARLFIAHPRWRKFSQLLERDLLCNVGSHATAQPMPQLVSSPQRVAARSDAELVREDQDPVEESAPAS